MLKTIIEKIKVNIALFTFVTLPSDFDDTILSYTSSLYADIDDIVYLILGVLLTTVILGAIVSYVKR